MKRCRFFVPIAASAVLLAGCGGTHYTQSQVEHAFGQAGLRQPNVQSGQLGVILNYGIPPHVVSVYIFPGAPPKVNFGPGTTGMLTAHEANVDVFYRQTEAQTVSRALDLLSHGG